MVKDHWKDWVMVMLNTNKNMKKLIFVLLVAVLIVSGCSQQQEPKTDIPKYKYLDIQFEEPAGWTKTYPYKDALPNGTVLGPDDVIYGKDEVAISVTSGGNLDELLKKSKERASVTSEDKTVGKLAGKFFKISSDGEKIFMEGFSFNKNNRDYFVAIISQKPIDENNKAVFTRLIESIN